MTVTYRPLTEVDIPAARALWRDIPGLSLGASDEPEDLKAFFLRNPSLSWGAFVDATLVGTVLSGHDGRRGFLYHVAVATECRGRGLSTELMNRVLDALALQGISKVHAFVLETNETGLAFWSHAASRGWHRREDLLLFSRDLS